MNDNTQEISRRKAAALSAICRATDNPNVALFATHHLGELDASYWQKHTGTPRPSQMRILELLELRSHWGGERNIDKFDFTLPDDVTDYVLVVTFEKNGNIQAIDTES